MPDDARTTPALPATLPTTHPTTTRDPGDPGTDVVLGGRYRLGKVLGTGGSATVYEAVVVEPGVACPGPEGGVARRVAVKVLHPHIATDPQDRETFVAEARSAAQVRHPGFAAVLDVGQDLIAGEHVAWIAMTLAPGGTLADLVAASPDGLPVAGALEIAARVLHALGAAHGVPLVHRDVSPRNVLVDVDDDGQVSCVTVLDLGLARVPGEGGDLAGDGALDEAVVGSAAYMSPEQARGLAVDARSDLYAVGALLHLMLTGHPPFERADDRSVLQAHVGAPVPVPSARRPALPRSVDELVSRALAKSPDTRYVSALEMHQAVTELLRDTGADGMGAGRYGSTRSMPAAGPVAPAATRVLHTLAAPSAAGTRLDARTGRTGGVPTAQGRPLAREAQHGQNPVSAVSAGRAFLVLLALVVGLGGIGWFAVSEPPRAADPTVEPSAGPGPATLPPAPVSTASPDPAAVPLDAPSGPVEVTVPDITGMALSAAVDRLTVLGLVPGETTTTDGTSPHGTVLTSHPAPGTLVPPGEVVRLVTASGAAIVPAVTGLTADRAAEALVAAGFVPSKVARADARVGVGAVVGTDPGTGTRLPLGSVVSVVVSDGPPVETLPQPSTEPAGTPSPTSFPSPVPTTEPTPQSSPTGAASVPTAKVVMGRP